MLRNKFAIVQFFISVLWLFAHSVIHSVTYSVIILLDKAKLPHTINLMETLPAFCERLGVVGLLDNYSKLFVRSAEVQKGRTKLQQLDMFWVMAVKYGKSEVSLFNLLLAKAATD